MIEGTGQHGTDRVGRVELLLLVRINRAAVHPDANGTIVLGRDAGDVPHLLLPRLLPFVVIQVARVVAELGDERGDLLGEAIVLLQVDGQVGVRAVVDLSEGVGLFLAVDGHPDDVSPGIRQRVDLPDGRLDVGRFGRRHALDGDRPAGADLDRSDADDPRRIAFEISIQLIRHREQLPPWAWGTHRPSGGSGAPRPSTATSLGSLGALDCKTHRRNRQFFHPQSPALAAESGAATRDPSAPSGSASGLFG